MSELQTQTARETYTQNQGQIFWVRGDQPVAGHSCKGSPAVGHLQAWVQHGDSSVRATYDEGMKVAVLPFTRRVSEGAFIGWINIFRQ